MTSTFDDDFDSDIQEPQDDPGDIKSLRRAANSKKKLEQELNDLRRELAFARAGISLDDPKMKYFVKGYDGEMTADAVKQAALEAGFLAAQSQASPQTEAIQASQQRVMTAAAGAAIEDSSEAAAFARLEAAMEEGGVDAMLDVARQYGIPIATEQ